MSERDAHYGGKLSPGAKVVELFGDIATELAIRHDGDEGPLAGYEYVQFLAPVFAGTSSRPGGRSSRWATPPDASSSSPMFRGY